MVSKILSSAFTVDVIGLAAMAGSSTPLHHTRAEIVDALSHIEHAGARPSVN